MTLSFVSWCVGLEMSMLDLMAGFCRRWTVVSRIIVGFFEKLLVCGRPATKSVAQISPIKDFAAGWLHLIFLSIRFANPKKLMDAATPKSNSSFPGSQENLLLRRIDGSSKKTKSRVWEDLTPPLAEFILEYLRYNNFKTPTPVQQVCSANPKEVALENPPADD